MAVSPGTLRYPRRLLAGTVEKLQEILQLSLALALDIPLLPSGIVDTPAEHGLVPIEFTLLPVHQFPPIFQHGRLVQQAIDYIGVHPVVLLGTGLEMRCDMFVVLLEFGVHGGTEAAPPSSSLPHVFDNSIGMGTCFAPMRRFVMLIKGVWSPEALITIWAWIFPPSLMELLLVPLPVEFALERLVTRCAPILGL